MSGCKCVHDPIKTPRIVEASQQLGRPKLSVKSSIFVIINNYKSIISFH